jgi:hypothetical protein
MNKYRLSEYPKNNYSVYHERVLIGVINQCRDSGIIFYQAVVIDNNNLITSDIWPTVTEAMSYLVRKYEEKT